MATKNSFPPSEKGERKMGKASHGEKGKKVTEEDEERGWTIDDSDSNIEDGWCFVSLYGTVENESDKEEECTIKIAQEVANIISKELLYNQEDELSAETVDEIFRTFEEVAEVDSKPLVTFLSARKHPKTVAEDEDDRSLSDVTDKSVLIALMVDLLRVSPEPEVIHLLWLRILTHFVLLTNDLQTLLDLKVAPTILGTMSAYRGSAEIQHFGCIALTVFAGTKPTPNSKAPLRDSAVQVLTQSLVNHTDNIDVVQPACLLISKVAEVMVTIPSWCMEQEFSAEETEKLCQSADNTLQCIKDGVIDRLEAISTRYSDIEEIKTSIAKLMACFGCYSSDRRFPDSERSFRPKAFTYPVSPKEKHVTFSHELEVILADNEENEATETKRCLSLDGTKMPQGGGEAEFTNRALGQPSDDTEDVHKDTEEDVRDEVTLREAGGGKLEEEKMEHSDCKLDDRIDKNDSHLSGDGDITVVGCCKDQLLCSEVENEVILMEPSSIGLSGSMLGGEEVSREDSWDNKCDDDVNQDCQEESDMVSLVSFKQGDLILSEKTLLDQEEPEKRLEASPNERVVNDGSLGDVADEMSDGVYSYDVQEPSNNYVEYSEFDIVEALVKSGLLNESESKPEIPRFPVDDAILNEGETDINLNGKEVLQRTSWEDGTENEKSLHSVGNVEGDNYERFQSENSAGEESKIVTYEGRGKSQRVVSEYDNVRTIPSGDDSGQDQEERIHIEDGKKNDGREVEEERGHEGFKQSSFDSGSHDLFVTQTEGETLGESAVISQEEGNEGDISESDILEANHDENDVQLRESNGRTGEEKFIDECYRMSTLSILQDDIQDVTWHENAAFRSTSSISEDNSVYSLTSAEYILDHDEDVPQHTENSLNGSVDALAFEDCHSDAALCRSEEGESELPRTESSASETSCSRSSCSSGSYCVQNGRLKEYRSMGSLDKFCNPRETQSDCDLDCSKKGNRSDVLKTMSCSNVDQVVPPPKPRRTWYYQSSWDVRRSLVRSFGPEYDTINIGNPIYDEPPAELYATVSKPKKKYQRVEPAYAKVQKKYLSPSSSEASNGSYMLKSGTNSSNDSGVVLSASKRKTRSHSHLYESITPLMTNDKETPGSIARYLEGDSSEATYEVCTLWVNDKCSEALETFNHLTQRLVSLYSIVPVAREEENRRSAVECDPDEMEDYPAWASILNVLASDETKWTLRLAAQALPIVDRLFQVKDKNVLNAVIELVQVLIKIYGKDIIKNRHPSLFKTRFREDCRTCFTWLGKLHLRTDFLLRKRDDAQALDWDCLLHSSLLDSFSESLQPFTQSSSKSK